MTQLAVAVMACSPTQAGLIVSLLEAEGIVAVVEGASLMDDWAVGQQLMGNMATQVKVPASQLEKALRILQEARERAHTGEEFEVDSPTPSASD